MNIIEFGVQILLVLMIIASIASFILGLIVGYFLGKKDRAKT